jgi:hypothetical protein
MAEKDKVKELEEQAGLAFEFVQKLYHEVSYLVREIETVLSEEEEKFVICRPSGYSISTVTSKGLEPVNVNNWLLRRFSVAFVSGDQGLATSGGTKTVFSGKLKVLYLRIILDDRDRPPMVYSGVLYGLKNKTRDWQKLENFLGHFEYVSQKAFKDPRKIDYEDGYVKMKGELHGHKLFSINTSDDVMKKIVGPALDIYRKV